MNNNIKMNCIVCNKNVEDCVHWTGDMFRWTKQNKRIRTDWDGIRFIVLCDDCF